MEVEDVGDELVGVWWTVSGVRFSLFRLIVLEGRVRVRLCCVGCHDCYHGLKLIAIQGGRGLDNQDGLASRLLACLVQELSRLSIMPV